MTREEVIPLLLKAPMQVVLGILICYQIYSHQQGMKNLMDANTTTQASMLAMYYQTVELLKDCPCEN